jgi:hypothetical protein
MRNLLIVLFVLCSLCVRAQQSLDIAFCDVEALYDTIPSKFYDDRAYTPQGNRHWDSQRYRHKVASVAALIDSMAMPVVALYGVENEAVVRDIALATKGDYAYIHRTMDSRDGLDCALLYYGDRLFPETITSWRGALCVECVVDGRKMAIIVNHRCSSLGVLMAERRLNDEGRSVIVLGTANMQNMSDLGLQDHSSPIEAAGRGNMMRSGRWQMRDHIASSWHGKVRCDVYAKKWLMSPSGGVLPTYDRNKYYGGVSGSLPIFAQFFCY